MLIWTNSSQTCHSENPFKLFQTTEVLYIYVYLVIFAILEIKTVKFLKDLFISK